MISPSDDASANTDIETHSPVHKALVKKSVRTALAQSVASQSFRVGQIQDCIDTWVENTSSIAHFHGHSVFDETPSLVDNAFTNIQINYAFVDAALITVYPVKDRKVAHRRLLHAVWHAFDLIVLLMDVTGKKTIQASILQPLLYKHWQMLESEHAHYAKLEPVADPKPSTTTIAKTKNKNNKGTGINKSKVPPKKRPHPMPINRTTPTKRQRRMTTGASTSSKKKMNPRAN